MTFLQAFRDTRLTKSLKEEIWNNADESRSYRFMEVCGTHTMSIFRYGIRSVLPENVDLLSGPGCPVCVTSIDYIDRALEIGKQPDVIVTTFGDMLRVPGSYGSLEKIRSEGSDVRIVYSPLDALALAKKEPERKVIFLAVGFETTIPTVAASVLKATNEGIRNFLVLAAHKVMPPAMQALAASGDLVLDGFLCPPHVSAITGTGIYKFLAKDYAKPCVVTGFEPTDILQGILMLLKQNNEGKSKVENQYSRVVSPDGNTKAREIIDKVFKPADSIWRGLGKIKKSGLAIKEAFIAHDASFHFNISPPESKENPACICGDVITGRKKPTQCRLFRTSCKPENPQGACMVSSEGTCAAYYKYQT